MIQLGQALHSVPVSVQYRHTSFIRGYDHESASNDNSDKFDKLLPRNSLSLYSSTDLPRPTPSPDDSETMAAASLTDATSGKGDSQSPETKTIGVKAHGEEGPREGQDRLPGIAHLDRQMLTPWSSGDNRYAPPQDRLQDRFSGSRVGSSDWNFDARYPESRHPLNRPSSPSWYDRASQSSPAKNRPSDDYSNQYISPRTRSPLEGSFSHEDLHRQPASDHPRWQYSSQRAAYGPPPAYGPYTNERSALPPLTDRSMRARERSPPSRSGYDSYRFHHGRGSDFTAETYSPHRAYPHLPRTSAPSLRSLSMPFHNDRHAEEHGSGAIGNHYEDSRRASPAMHSSPRHHPYAMQGGHIPDSPPNNIPRRRGKLPKPVTDLLKTWLLDHAAHPYPTEDEKRRLCAATGLSISQVSNWFINARRRILVPQGSGHFGVSGGGSHSGGSSSGMHQGDPRMSPSMGMHDRGHRMMMEPAPHPHHHEGHARNSMPVHRYASGSHYPSAELYTRSADHSPR